MPIDEYDIRIDTYTNSSPKIRMTVIHCPTGLHVSGEGVSWFRLRDKLVAQLEKRYEEHEKNAQTKTD